MCGCCSCGGATGSYRHPRSCMPAAARPLLLLAPLPLRAVQPPVARARPPASTERTHCTKSTAKHRHRRRGPRRPTGCRRRGAGRAPGRQPGAGRSDGYQSPPSSVAALMIVTPEERVERQWTGTSAASATGYGQRPGSGSSPISGQKNRQPDDDEVHVHQLVQQLVSQRRRTGRRSTARTGVTTNRPNVSGGKVSTWRPGECSTASSSRARPRRQRAQGERHRRAERQEDRRDHRQHHVLDHVDAQQRVVVGREARAACAKKNEPSPTPRTSTSARPASGRRAGAARHTPTGRARRRPPPAAVSHDDVDHGRGCARHGRRAASSSAARSTYPRPSRRANRTAGTRPAYGLAPREESRA